MKTAISFICGAALCGIILLGIKPGLPTFADTANASTTNTADVSATSDNASQGIISTISGIDKVYRQALTEPFVKAGSKITDPDIADYYNGLMEKTGLTNPNSN